jgi:hypothetical protein
LPTADAPADLVRIQRAAIVVHPDQRPLADLGQEAFHAGGISSTSASIERAPCL